MNLTVQSRETSGKGSNRKLRNQGLTPGIIYGKENIQVSMNQDKTLRFIKAMRGGKKVFELGVEINGNTENKKVVIQDFQMSKVGNRLLHVDFFEVSDNTKLTVEVPIKIINDVDCPAIKEGGVIQMIRRTIPVTCSALNVPEEIEIDVKDLEFSESIHVLDIEYPEGVKPIVKDRDFTLITVAGKMAEETEAAEGEEVEAAEGEGEEAEKESSDAE
jgi:large subunit ribosomal protein L25